MQWLSQGQVVRIAVPDPRGKNPKSRPVVILTETAELADNDEFVVACISTQFSEPLPQHCIPAPWSPDGHAKSGLRQPSVVKCRWLLKVKREDVEETLGHLSSATMLDIMREVTRA